MRNAMIWAMMPSSSDRKNHKPLEFDGLYNGWISLIIPMAIFSSVKDRLYTPLERCFKTKQIVDACKYSFYP